MLTDWSAGAVATPGGKPEPATWEPVEVPGRPASFAGEDVIAYRTTFPDPRDGDEALALLTLRGTYAHARVWLNDELVTKQDAYFEPVRLPFKPQPDNELVVECRRPDDRFGGVHDTDRLPAAACVPGIWWEASLSTHPDPFVVGVDATPRLTGDGAAVDARVEVYAGTAVDDRLTLSTRPAGDRRGRGMMDRAAVTAEPGERVTISHTIELPDPSLWWPRGVGGQDRYVIRAKLADAAAETTTGVASVEHTDDGFLVNGREVPVRGVTLVDGTVGDVERAVETNANLVRAHAHALPGAVYEACDEAGLLVWQDLPLTGPGTFDIARGQDLVGRLADSYAHHPSLAAFAVHDDPVAGVGRLGDGLLDRLRLRWRAWRTDYDRGPAEEVAAEFPDDWPTFPVVGGPGTAPDASALYPGWEYGSAADLDWLCERYGLDDVVAEFGAGALSSENPRETAGFDRETHDARTPDASVAESQAYQASVVSTVAQRLRCRGADVVVADSLCDAGDAGTGVYARDGTPKAAADDLATAFEPVQAFLADPTPGESDIVVANDTPGDVGGTLAWELDGDTDQTEVTVPAAGRTTATSVDVPDDAEVTLEFAYGDGRARNQYRS
jgi:beta-mannosidase